MSESHYPERSEVDLIELGLPPSLCLCGNCASPFLFPADFENEGDDVLQVTLSCTNCGKDKDIPCDLGILYLLEERANTLENEISNNDQIHDTMEFKADMAHMSLEAEQFITALRANIILPEDF